MSPTSYRKAPDIDADGGVFQFNCVCVTIRVRAQVFSRVHVPCTVSVRVCAAPMSVPISIVSMISRLFSQTSRIWYHEKHISGGVRSETQLLGRPDLISKRAWPVQKNKALSTPLVPGHVPIPMSASEPGKTHGQYECQCLQNCPWKSLYQCQWQWNRHC